MMLDEHTHTDLEQDTAEGVMPIYADEEDETAMQSLEAIGVSREDAAIVVRLLTVALW
jgi:hypothetical protein